MQVCKYNKKKEGKFYIKKKNIRKKLNQNKIKQLKINCNKTKVFKFKTSAAKKKRQTNE